ncbi:MAG: hypothetical protein KBS41_05070, partial [Oscillospiraceae bacterium]|nr:hypothetical protein [Candidatus Equicaccousia limihippi]
SVIIAAVLCCALLFCVNVCAEEVGDKLILAELSYGKSLNFTYETDDGALLIQCLSVPKNYSGTKYYAIGSSFTETVEASADLALIGRGDGSFVLKYIGKEEKEQNKVVKIGENVKFTTAEGDVVYPTVKVSVVYGGVKKEVSSEGTISVWIDSENASVIQSGADNVSVLGASSLIDLTNEKEDIDTPTGSQTQEAANNQDFPVFLIIVLILLVIIAAAAALYFAVPAFKEKVDAIFNKNGKNRGRKRK